MLTYTLLQKLLDFGFQHTGQSLYNFDQMPATDKDLKIIGGGGYRPIA